MSVTQTTDDIRNTRTVQGHKLSYTGRRERQLANLIKAVRQEVTTYFEEILTAL